MAPMCGWVQRGEDLSLSTEARQTLRLVCEDLRQNFQGNVATELGILRTIDLTHPTAAKERQNLVSAEASARSQAHVAGTERIIPRDYASCP